VPEAILTCFTKHLYYTEANSQPNTLNNVYYFICFPNHSYQTRHMCIQLYL